MKYHLMIALLFSFLVGLALFSSQPSADAARHQSAESLNPSEEFRALVPGIPIEREISGYQTHPYKITLSAGQFFQASIQQKGIDLLVILVGPDKRKLDEFSEPVYENRVRKILFIAESDGDYHLLIRPRLKDGAPAFYEITVQTMRPATEPDKTLTSAAKITKDANYSLGNVNQLSGEELAKVAGKLEEAVQLWQTLGDLQMIGECYLSLGIVNYRSSELTKAIGYYEKALSLFPQTSQGKASRATTLNNMANIYIILGETRRALETLLKSLELKKEEGRSRGITVDNIGSVYVMLGEYQQALDHHLQALAIFRTLARRRDEAVALNNIAWLWESMGDSERAVEYILQALPLVKEAGDKAGEALYLANAGNFYFQIGENRKALEYANQSYNLSREINNRRTETGSLILLCKIYPSLGEFEKALDACNRVSLMSKNSGDRINQARILTALSRVYEKTGERTKAIESREAALAIYRAIGDPTGELTTLHALGQLALESGDLLSARSKVERAVEMAESLRIKVGSHQLRSTYMAGMQQVYESYVDLLMQMHMQDPGKGYEQTAFQYSERARARSLLDLLAESHARIRQGADPALLEMERTILERLSAKDAALTNLRNREQTKKQIESMAGEINDLETNLQSIESQIRATSPRYAALTQPKPLAASEVQEEVLDENTVLLEYALGDKRSWLWTITRDSIDSYQLPPRTEINAAARNVYELLIARQPKKGLSQTEQLKQIDEADAKLNAATAALSRVLLGPVFKQLDGEWKGRRLAVVASGPLEYVPFAVLPLPEKNHQATEAPERPTFTLTVSYAPLIANHEIVNLPSASALDFIRRETVDRNATTKLLAVLADPVFDGNDPRLAAVKKKSSINTAYNLIPGGRSAERSNTLPDKPSELTRSSRSFGRDGFGRLVFSKEEAEFITSFAPRSSTLKATGFAANHALVSRGELGRYRIVHFATHGLINSEHPELSGLVLSLIDENGKPQDGFLRMHEIFNLQLPADLVVLSACQTALGKEIKGEGLIGLTRGFMYAGAERVVASLWQVDDQATAQLMKYFYRGMLKDGLRPAAALRAAQIAMSRNRRWSSPYYWAGFILQGEWK